MTDLDVKNLIGDPKGNPTENTMSRLPAILDYLLKKGVDPTILAEKADKDEDAVVGNLAKFDASGNPVDAGIAATELNQLSHQAIYDVTANNADAKFASLSVLLSSENLSTLIPVAVRCGGMSIRFERSSDNKYMQYRLLTEAFSTNVDNWEEAGKAGITSVNASIGTNDPTQAPSVDVTGPVDGVLGMIFNNIKGAKGEQGEQGERGEQGAKGDKGDKGDKGEPSVAVENYVTVEATSSTTSATDVLPVTGNSDTVYRVANWDGNQYDETAYTEYGWYNGAYKQLATRTPGIDDEPTENSSNLVKSGGAAAQISQLGQEMNIDIQKLILERGSISQQNGKDVDSTTRVRTSYLRAPFNLVLNDGYIITIAAKYNQDNTFVESIGVNNSEYSVYTGDYHYRLVIKKGSAGTDTISPDEDIVDSYTATNITVEKQSLSDTQKARVLENLGAMQENNVGYYVCSSAADAVQKVVSVGNSPSLASRQYFIKMTYANTANNCTMKIGSSPALPLYFNGVRLSSITSWEAGDILFVYTDGINYYASVFDDKWLWLVSSIPGTTQEVSFNSSNKPSSVEHKRNGNTIRTDAFTYSATSIVETRTAGNKNLTLTTNLQTLNTEISWN